MVERIHTDTLLTNHKTQITSLRFDFYGQRLATSSSDSLIRIYDSATHRELCVLEGHEGSVLSLDWSHPAFGSLILSGGNDKRAIIWKETSLNNWNKVYEYEGHAGPISAVKWSGAKLGLFLLVGSQDGCISLLKNLSEDSWDILKFFAHRGGVNDLSWDPDIQEGRRFVSGGKDGKLSFWNIKESEVEEEVLGHYGEDIRGVEFNRLGDKIGVCSEKGKVWVWSLEKNFPREVGASLQGLGETRSETREEKMILAEGNCLWSINWDLTGGILAVSGEEDYVKFFKSDLEGNWDEVY